MSIHSGTEVPPLVCAGRAVDDQLRPVGEPCGIQFEPQPAGGSWVVAAGRVDADGSFGPSRRPTPEEQDEQARGAGWAVHILPDGQRVATCPKCRKPNPAVVADCRAIENELLARPNEPATTEGAPK